METNLGAVDVNLGCLVGRLTEKIGLGGARARAEPCE